MLVQSQYHHDVGMLENIAMETFQFMPGRLEEVLDLCASIRQEDEALPEVKERPTDVVWKCGHVFTQ